MNKEERHECLLEETGRRGLLYLHRAMELTRASRATVRRDFEEMAESGWVERVRGGIRVRKNEGSSPFDLREVQNAEAKSMIARQAVRLLSPGEVVFVDGGTTTFFICMHLPPIPLRIVTNSIRLATQLDSARHYFPEREVFLTGGKIHHGDNLLTGPGTLHSLDFYHADWAFLSVGGIASDGLYNTSENVVESERKMIERSDRPVVLADASKLGRRAMCRVCGVHHLARLITNHQPGQENILQGIRKQGCQITEV